MENEIIRDIIDTINLYKNNEVYIKTNLVISTEFSNPNKRIISLTYGDNYSDKKDFIVENGIEFDNQNVFEIINTFKKGEIYREDSVIYNDENSCTYQCTFDSGRKVTLENVSFLLVNVVKSILTGQVYQLDILRQNGSLSSFNNSIGGFTDSLLLIVGTLLVLDIIYIVYLWIKYMSY